MYDKRQDTFVLNWAKKLMAMERLGGKCTCGICEPILIEFHHVDRSGKENTINELGSKRFSVIEKELSKCILLCANCHAEEHFVGTYPNVEKALIKKRMLELKGASCCSKCSYHGRSFSSLEFHHRAEKNFELWTVSFNKLKIPLKTLLTELELCDVLCRNCHRKQHFDIDRFNRLLPAIKIKMETYQEHNKIDHEQVRMLYESGMPQIEISRKIGCTKSSICEIVKGFRPLLVTSDKFVQAPL